MMMRVMLRCRRRRLIWLLLLLLLNGHCLSCGRLVLLLHHGERYLT